MNSKIDITDTISNFWKNQGFGSISILTITLTLQIVDSYIYPLLDDLYQKPNLLLEGQIWRLFTAVLISGSVFKVILFWFILSNCILKLEQIVGSGFLLLDFFLKSLIIQNFCAIMYFLLSYYDYLYFYQKSYGIFPMLVYYICSLLAASPFTIINLWMISITSFKLLFAFPILSYLLTSNLDIIPALTVALVEQFCFNGMLFRISPVTLQYLESLAFLIQFTNFENYKKPSQSFQEPKSLTVNNQAQVSNNQEAFKQFQGRPIVIGTDEVIAQNNNRGTDYLELQNQ